MSKIGSAKLSDNGNIVIITLEDGTKLKFTKVTYMVRDREYEKSVSSEHVLEANITNGALTVKVRIGTRSNDYPITELYTAEGVKYETYDYNSSIKKA
ncbi:MAG: hypothetical protein OXR68_01240 [Alphaproteobacteria bacterium]|nr:hypothetical protein [Alphaproteobacteria bacterium]MDD9919235.1 hypothetical protein [Alphaproteobacteria bacterium]